MKTNITRARIGAGDLPDPVRRRVLRYGINSLGLIAAGQLLAACRGGASSSMPVGELRASGVPGLLLPEGFSARVIARSGEPVIAGGDFRWHDAPDGGAVFPAPDGGWIYVSNSEMAEGAGGAGAIRFNSGGDIVDAYPVLAHTSRNCAGGPTPWNTWLSCEEVPYGHVFECDPAGTQPSRKLPALGAFMHEAVAIDPRTLRLYMTEDVPDGRFYRFTPASVQDGMPDLSSGQLEAAEWRSDGGLVWHAIADPSGVSSETRFQAPRSTPFAGGEGAWHANGVIWFTTKGDGRVWAHDIETGRLDVIYDAAQATNALLTGVDNVTVSQAGTVYVAEDGGNMQIVAIDAAQRVFPVMQLLGHEKSEVAGPAFDASGTRLYFSSQRGAVGSPQSGVTYEVTGPFN